MSRPFPGTRSACSNPEIHIASNSSLFAALARLTRQGVLLHHEGAQHGVRILRRHAPQGVREPQEQRRRARVETARASRSSPRRCWLRSPRRAIPTHSTPRTRRRWRRRCCRSMRRRRKRRRRARGLSAQSVMSFVVITPLPLHGLCAGLKAAATKVLRFCASHSPAAGRRCACLRFTPCLTRFGRR